MLLIGVNGELKNVAETNPVVGLAQGGQRVRVGASPRDPGQ
jgi:hypothetical protein